MQDLAGPCRPGRGGRVELIKTKVKRHHQNQIQYVHIFLGKVRILSADGRSPYETNGQLTWQVVNPGFSAPARSPSKTLYRLLELAVGRVAFGGRINRSKHVFKNVLMK